MASTVVRTTNVAWGRTNLMGDPGRPRANYLGSISQTVASYMDGTAAGFYYDESTLQGTTTALDEGSDWYVVHAGDEFSSTTISQNAFAPLITLGPIYYNPVTVDSADDLYLGIATSRGFPINRNVFGWVRLHDVDGILVMIDNAVSYDSPGIYVGTITVVPEPAAVCVVAGAFALLARRRVGERQ